jgi:hypothetical protein
MSLAEGKAPIREFSSIYGSSFVKSMLNSTFGSDNRHLLAFVGSILVWHRNAAMQDPASIGSCGDRYKPLNCEPFEH